MTINYSNNSVYKKFMAVPTTKTLTAQNPAVKEEPAASVKVGEIKEEKESRGYRKVLGIVGISVGSAALLTLIGLFALSKGFSSGFAKKFENLSRKLQKSITDLSDNTKELTKSQKLKLYFSRTAKGFADTMQASSNFTAVKDGGFRHFAKKWKMEPLIQKINVFFKGIVTKTTSNAYMKAEKSNLELCTYLDEIAKKTGDVKLKEYAEKIRHQFNQSFTYSKHYNRAEETYKKMEGLDEKVYDTLFANGGMFKNMKKYGKYITTDLVSDQRAALDKMIKNSKSVISNNVHDNYNNIKQVLGDIELKVSPSDKSSVDILKKLSQTLEEYKAASGQNEKALRSELTGTLQKEVRKLLESMKKNPEYKDKLTSADEKIADFLSAVDPEIAKKGLAQEAITRIKEITRGGKYSEEYEVAKSKMSKLNKNLNNAIESELNSFEKLAELQVGSAPTDILGILGPSAIAAALVANSKDKDERISKTLTKGIPILGGIGMSYLGTVRGYTGAKNLLLGLGTGALLNVIGTKTDELYKKYIEKQNLLKSALTSLAKLQSKAVPAKEETLT